MIFFVKYGPLAISALSICVSKFQSIVWLLFSGMNSVFRYCTYSTPTKFFAPTPAGGLSPEYEWQEISPCLQNPSQYTDRSQQWCSLDYTQLFQPTFNCCELFQMLQLKLWSPSPLFSTAALVP